MRKEIWTILRWAYNAKIKRQELSKKASVENVKCCRCRQEGVKRALPTHHIKAHAESEPITAQWGKGDFCLGTSWVKRTKD